MELADRECIELHYCGEMVNVGMVIGIQYITRFMQSYGDILCGDPICH